MSFFMHVFVLLLLFYLFFFFFKQKTAYEMRISDWSSDVCSSDLILQAAADLEVPSGFLVAEQRRALERRRAALLRLLQVGDLSPHRFELRLQELDLGGLIFRSSNHSVLGESGRGKAAKRGRSEQGGSRLQLHWVTPLWCTGLVSRRALGGCGDRSETLLLQLGDKDRKSTRLNSSH